MNDTIVIFDRIRENLKIMRREPLESLINKSVNQTLSRTVMTSGLTFLTVIALFLFGGPVLHGFSFALVWVLLSEPIRRFSLPVRSCCSGTITRTAGRRTAPVVGCGSAEPASRQRQEARRRRRSKVDGAAGHCSVQPRLSKGKDELVCLSKHSSKVRKDQEDLDGARCRSLGRSFHRHRGDHPDDLLRRAAEGAVDQFPGGAAASASSASASRRASAREGRQGDPAPVRRRPPDGAQERSRKKSRRLKKKSCRRHPAACRRGRRRSGRRCRWYPGGVLGGIIGSVPSAAPPPPPPPPRQGGREARRLRSASASAATCSRRS